MPEAHLARVAELLVALDAELAEPLHRQVYRGIREAILSGRLAAGVRIPSTRRLADSLDISRSTLLVAFEQLIAEGYLVGVVGSGSYVARRIPDRLLQVQREARATETGSTQKPRLAARVAEIQGMHRGGPWLGSTPLAFRSGIPPTDCFPLTVWSRLAGRCYRRIDASQLSHGSPLGYRPLREAIVSHLAASRGMRCSLEQVIVLSSAQEALELTTRVLLDPGDPVWLEDPSWFGARGALTAAGARIVPVPVDSEGLMVERGIAAEPGARLAYVSPSHQYPASVMMSLERRLTLLHWAAQSGSWILEDDYDSEYRYAGYPLTALAGLDAAARVLYVGTFNKTMFPALRLGYLVVPESLIEAFVSMRRIGAQHAPTIEQSILTDFISEGHYERHLRRTRAICRERRDCLIAAANRELPDVLEFAQVETGLHTVGWLSSSMDDVAIASAAAREGVEASPISRFYAGPCPRGGLVLGYAGFSYAEIDAGMRRLADAVRSVR